MSHRYAHVCFSVYVSLYVQRLSYLFVLCLSEFVSACLISAVACYPSIVASRAGRVSPLRFCWDPNPFLMDQCSAQHQIPHWNHDSMTWSCGLLPNSSWVIFPVAHPRNGLFLWLNVSLSTIPNFYFWNVVIVNFKKCTIALTNVKSTSHVSSWYGLCDKSYNYSFLRRLLLSFSLYSKLIRQKCATCYLIDKSTKITENWNYELHLYNWRLLQKTPHIENYIFAYIKKPILFLVAAIRVHL